MALKVGSLYVSLTADAGHLVKGLAEGLSAVQGFSKELKRAAREVHEVGAVIKEMGKAALEEAEKVNGPAKEAAENLKKAQTELAVATSSVLLPALEEVGKQMHTFASYLNGLNPETKEAISTFAKWAVEIGGVAFVVSKVSGAVAGLSGMLSEIVEVIAVVGAGPIVAVIAGIAAIALGVVALHAAWRTNFMGIREIVDAVAKWFVDTWDKAVYLVKESFQSLVDVVANMAKLFIEAQATVAAMKVNDPQQMRLIRTAADASKQQVDNLASDFRSGSGGKKLITAALEIGRSAKDSFLAEFGLIADELESGRLGQALARLKAMLSSTNEDVKIEQEYTVKGLGFDQFEGQNAKFVRDLMKQKDVTAGHNSINALLPENILKNVLKNASSGAVSGAGTLSPDPSIFNEQGMKAVGAALQSVGDHILDAGKSFLGKMGAFGEVVNQVIEGAKSGGVAGAITAAITALLEQTKAFADLVAVANGFLARVVRGLEPAAKLLFGALERLLAPIMDMLVPVLAALTPAFEAVANLLDELVPILEIVGMLVAGLAPILAFLGDVLKIVIEVLKPVFQVVFEVARIVFFVILGIIDAVLKVWNGLLDAVAAIVDAVVSVFTAGAVTNGGDFIRAGKADETGVTSAMDALSGATWDSTTAMAANSVATARAAGAAQQAYESLTNVPTGYKIALARFNSDLGIHGTIGNPGGAGASGTVIVNGNVTVNAGPSQTSLSAILGGIRKENVRNTGNPYGIYGTDPNA